MSESASGQSGGVNNTSGTMNTGGGDVVGGHKTTTTIYTAGEVNAAWQPVEDVIRAAPIEKRAEAAARLDELKRETAKDAKADDRLTARLVKGLVALAPSAVSAIAGAFGTPILAGIAGPATKFVLDELGEGGK